MHILPKYEYINGEMMRKFIFGIAFVFYTGISSAAVVVEYNFDSNALDSSGNNEHLTLNGGVGYGAGYTGQALALDGINDFAHVNLGNYALTNFTVEAWVNVPSYNANVHYVSLYQDNYIVLGDYGGPSDGSVSTWVAGLAPIDAGNTGLIETVPPVNEWHHLAFTFDGVNQNIYVDGILEKSIATAGTLTSNPGLYNLGLTIGARYTGTTQFVSGFLDNVRIHDVALPAAQLGFFQDTLTASTAVPTLSEFGIFLLILSLLSTVYFKQRRTIK